MTHHTHDAVQETQTTITNAIGAFYGAQIALQKNALDAARTAVETTISMQRTGLDAVNRALVANATAQTVDKAAFADSVRSFAASLPGMTPEAAEKIAKDMAAAYAEVQATAARAGDAVRQVAQQGAAQYADVLARVEGGAKPAFAAAGDAGENATLLASRVTGAWVAAFFEAARAAAKAAEETGDAFKAPRTPPAKPSK